MLSDSGWTDPDPALVDWICGQQGDVLQVYAADPLLVDEHGRQEDSYRTGGYATRQVLELAQNAADALRRSEDRGRVELRLTGDALYCANEGAPIDRKGLEAISHAHLSGKHGEEMGRFGLGFKSVLAVTDTPAIFSRSVAVGFDAGAAQGSLQPVAPDAKSFPILRWPMVLDADKEMVGDATLRELGDWAQTIVRLPLKGDRTRLIEDLTTFPAEFLLFAPHVSSLIIGITDQPEPYRQELVCEPLSGDRWRIAGGGTSSEWMVWHQTHRPSEEALAEVGHAIRRSEIRVSYAAPMDDTQPLGQFWAYFPLQDQTSARGIHNAPWRVNDDRTSLLPGLFNQEILDVIAGLIVEAMPSLATKKDPARHFDYLPARGREAQYAADKYLTEAVPARARDVASVPDMTGKLRRPEELEFLHSEVRLELKSFQRWQKYAPAPDRGPHSSCFTTTTRRARLRTLIRADDRSAAPSEISAANWLERLVPSGADDECRSALDVLFSIDDETTRREFRSARIIPDEDEVLRELNQTRELYIRGNLLSTSAGLKVMRSSFVEDGSTAARLRELGFTDVDPSVELQRLASGATKKWSAQEWEVFWDLVLDVPAHEADRILEEHASHGVDLRVRTRSGKWMSLDGVVFPGIVEPTNPDLSIDEKFHELHASLIGKLGVGIRPLLSKAALHDRTFSECERHTRTNYLERLPAGQRPSSDSLHFQQPVAVGPLYVLMRFGDCADTAAQVAWTRELLEVDADPQAEFGHLNAKKFPTRRVTAPHIWAAQRYGLLGTSWGPRQPHLSLSPALREYRDVLPVADSEAATKVNVITSLSSAPDALWLEFLGRTPVGGTAWQLGELVALASRQLATDAVLPETVPAVLRDGYELAPARNVLVAATEEECRALQVGGQPFVAVESMVEAAHLCERLGCEPASSALRVEYSMEHPAEPEQVLDRYGGLRGIARGLLDGWEIITCTDLHRAITTRDGTRTDPVEIAFDQRLVMHVGHLTEPDVIAAISNRFELGLDALGIERLLSDARDQRIKLRIAECRSAETLPDKLLALLPAATLESVLPSGLLSTVRALSGDMGEKQVAELLHHVHGYNVLIELKHQLADEGYGRLDQWAGSSPAVAFVRNLGVPEEYAGSRGSSLASSETVQGPPRLNPLHDFQQELRDRVRVLVRRSETPQRALLFLPTGAGKTRVTVQALVESIIDGEVTGPLLWIAQTEELCEQAVQTWTTVWREFGTHPLKLYRLWSRNEVAQTDDDVCVVVATDAKLDSIRERGEYEWLAERAHAVVIDEAHGATGAGISATLRWLGLDGKQTARPLLGLTATPFAGTGEEKNRRLAGRFGKQLLDVLGEDPYGALQDLGVLARVEHRELDGGEFSLEKDELPQFETFHDVPATVLERVGRDHARTQTLVGDIASLPPGWPVLVFTPSVLSAQILAALLRVQGIEAATVSGTTPIYERRRSIEAFRQGQVRVLTNCNVLTQGFDAPAVRALYIARPTFSPNAYIQMVGRGLRGPLNGGKEECLVVNVADTFSQFGAKLAYREFDYLWTQQGGSLR